MEINEEYIDLDYIKSKYYDRFCEEATEFDYHNHGGEYFKQKSADQLDGLFDLNNFEIQKPVRREKDFYDWERLKKDTEELQSEYKDKTKYELFLYAAYKQLKEKIKSFEEYFADYPYPAGIGSDRSLEERAIQSYSFYVCETLGFEQAEEHLLPSCNDHPLKKQAWYNGIDPEITLDSAAKGNQEDFKKGWMDEGMLIDLVLKPTREITKEDADAMEDIGMTGNIYKHDEPSLFEED